jgi:glycosyltransferase involved in cell wall biosynthesis
MSVSVWVSPEELERDRPESARSCATRRALHVINGEHYSGAERVQDLLALDLGDQGFEVGFACLKPGKFDALRQARSTPLRTLKMRSRLDLRPAWQLAQWVRQDHYDLIHTHTPRAALIGRLASWLAGVPLVHHVHSPTGRDSTRPWQDAINARTENFSLTGVAAVIAVSRSLANYAAAQGIPRTRIHVVPNGVPVIGPLADRRLPSGTWTLGTVALFRPRKGLEVLLESVAHLRSAGHDVRLRAIGEFESPEYRQQIESQIARLGIASCIEWTGFTSDVPAELARLDLFVLPSLFGEGLPMVVLEAMASGVPVVGTRVEGVPEAIRDRIDGLLAQPNDAADLARAISQFVCGDVDWFACREHAHRRQAEFFSDESMARGVAEIYREVLNR